MDSGNDRALRALRNSLPWMIAAGLLVMGGVALSFADRGQPWPIVMFIAAPVLAIVGYLILRRGIRDQ